MLHSEIVDDLNWNINWHKLLLCLSKWNGILYNIFFSKGVFSIYWSHFLGDELRLLSIECSFIDILIGISTHALVGCHVVFEDHENTNWCYKEPEEAGTEVA